MRCEFCGEDFSDLYFLPKPDGSGDAFGCRTCGIEKGVLCVRHDAAHTLFLPDPFSRADMGTACILCIAEIVEAKRNDAETIYECIAATLPELEQERIKEWLEAVTPIRPADTPSLFVLRAVVTRAQWKKTSVEAVLREIHGAQSVTLLLPFPF